MVVKIVMFIFDTYLQTHVLNMSKIREKFIELRKESGLSKSSFEGIMSRHTVKRFEEGGDITFSKLESAVEKMGKKLIILK